MNEKSPNSLTSARAKSASQTNLTDAWDLRITSVTLIKRSGECIKSQFIALNPKRTGGSREALEQGFGVEHSMIFKAPLHSADSWAESHDPLAFLSLFLSLGILWHLMASPYRRTKAGAKSVTIFEEGFPMKKTLADGFAMIESALRWFTCRHLFAFSLDAVCFDCS